MIYTAFTFYPEILLHTFNTMLKNTHKIDSEDDPDNYRGIALKFCLAKFFYSIMNNRLLKYCLKNKILSPTQLGFLQGKRTSDAHIILHNFIKKYCHKMDQSSMVVSLTLAKPLITYQAIYYLTNL